MTQLLDTAIQILTPVVILFLTWLAHKAIKLFEAKTGIQISEERERQLDGWVHQAVSFAEEKGHQVVKKNEAKLSGPEKLDIALGFVLDLVKKQGWDQWTSEQIQKKIEAALNLTRPTA